MIENHGSPIDDADRQWTARVRSHLLKGNPAPAICIQGGGARGAWEAGALAGLLHSGPNTTPSSIWGTSAGALNALWSRDPVVRHAPDELLRYWMKLAWRLAAGAVGFLCALLLVLWCLPPLVTVSTFTVIAASLGIVYAMARMQWIVRLPGIIPVAVARLIVPRPRAVGPGWYVYTCVTNVDAEMRPDFWDNSRRGWFCLDKDAATRSAEDMADGEMVDAFHVAVASASVPVVVRPTRLAGMTLLDGGLVANLPAGVILSNGALGGAYVLCLVPRPISDLSAADPIDFRTLLFLHALRREQAEHRRIAASAKSWSGPVHTHIPVFVLCPSTQLKTGLSNFWPPLIKREFFQGRGEAREFAAALDAFGRQQDDRLCNYLLERVLDGHPAPEVEPGRKAWHMWANTGW